MEVRALTQELQENRVDVRRAEATTLGLVLGGGGVAGIAWEIGVIAGLADEEVDVSQAHCLVGTSAGAVVGAQIADGVPLDELYEAQVSESVPERNVPFALLDEKRRWADLVSGAPDSITAVRRIGDYALQASTTTESERLEVISARLPRREWPDRDLLVTSVDVETGHLVTWSRAEDVDLSLAVAASCAMPGAWPPVTIAGRRYMDGGIESTTHATLARQCGSCLILAPFPGGLLGGGTLEEEVDELRQRSAVAAICPDPEAMAAFGSNPLDPATRVPAAIAGRRQGRQEAERIADILGLP
jgi:NTE family protein